MTARKVVIVGAGALGLGCAYALADRSDVEVQVVERKHAGAGSSSLAVGMALRLQRREFERALLFRAYELLEPLSEATGLPLRRIGSLMPGHSEEDLAAFEDMRSQDERLGRRSFEILDRRALLESFPDFQPADGVIGAAWDSSAFYVDGNELCTVLTDVLRDKGVPVRTRTEVTGLQQGGKGARYTVETTKGPVPADIVINCGGAWSGVVGDRLSAPVRTLNERHEAYIFRTSPTQALLPMMLDYIPGRSSVEGLYFRSEGPDRLVAGLHSSDVLHTEAVSVDTYSQKLDPDQMETVFGLLTNALPDLDLGFEGGWAGLYPHHPANRYVLGPHPANPDVILGVGLGGRGLGPALALGEILADWVVHGQPVRLAAATTLAPDETT